MDAPVCRVCGKKHWSHEDHVFEDHVFKEGPPKVSIVKRQELPEAPDEPKETGQVARNRRWRQKNREKYNAYMREYRRKAR